MRDEEAATYIKNHAEYIRDVIGKHNKESEIVFLCEEELPVPENFPFRYYRMKEKYCGAPRRALRTYFDGAEEFLSFCGQNYSGAELIKNLAFDMKEEQLQADLLQRRYTTLGGIIQHDFENIKNQLCNKQYKEEDIISLDDILKLTF